MSTSQGAAPVPQIDGYEFRRVLGAGGFSTVYLCEQLRPRREVAIKVLTTAALTPAGRRRFEIESDLMAELSAHPFIVTIHDADITADATPYLVMEYYPGANLGLRARTERLGLAEILQVGIHIASAVESAHRIGILHRDIKPANVLTSRYNRPGLTDFGISVSASTGEHDEVALSIPWSPPEAFDPSISPDARADIYSLGALIYSLLTGRSPFEIDGGDNSADAISQRIVHDIPLPIQRNDVPVELERLLMQTMSRRPELRPSSALDLARALQAIEMDLSLPPSQIDVMQEVDAAGSPIGDGPRPEGEPTRLRVLTLSTIARESGDVPDQTLIDHELSGLQGAEIPQTRILESDAPIATVRIQQESRRRPLLLLAALAAVLLVVLAAMAIIRGGGSDTDVTPPLATPIGTPTPTAVAVIASAAPKAPVVSHPAAKQHGAKNAPKPHGPKKEPGKGPKPR